ncbi:hypothetical protein BDW59DRAFT_147817 [Aspergillus cavernicola]|uniref:Uncharacterized protein n=1 Tax=Aspergillus cavernicola TaxID=176166 RepID=A0ABR4I8L7_9EURO
MQPGNIMDGQPNAQSLELNREIPEFNSNLPIDETTPAPVALPASVISQKFPDYNDSGTLDGNMQVAAQDSGYNSSGSSVHQPPAETLNGGAEDHKLIHTRSRASSRTSISSIPASVLTNLPDGPKPMDMRDAHDYMFHPWDNHGPRPVHTIRQREAMFRKPSSVRAMQMHTEDEGDDEFLTPPKRRGSHRSSDISIRSAGPSPLKRSPFYSPTGAAAKPKVKKEYPLVLLHCTLLAPSLPVNGLVGHPDRQKFLRDVLPTEYWKRWKMLEEKIGSGVLRDRGVLISHPEDMYDLLEERLLESLELQRPRLDHGHFIGRDETESDKEDRLSREDSSTEDEGEECADCGGRVVRHNTTRKWEIKVFAANGLMRAGAWAAAWKEMEKVDVEVGLWLPPDARAELERRLVEDSPHLDNSLLIPLLQEPEDLTVGPPVRALTPSLSQVEPVSRVTQGLERSPSPGFSTVNTKDDPKSGLHARKSDEIDLQTLLVNYIRVLANDRRNVAIVFLSILVVFVAINSKTGSPALDWRSFPGDIHEYTASSIVPLHQHATQTWDENTSAETLSVAVPDSLTELASTVAPGAFSSSEECSSLTAESSVFEPEELSPMATETLSAEITQDISEELSPTTSEILPSGDIQDVLEDVSPATTDIRSAENSQVTSEEQEELAQPSRAASLEKEPVSPTISVAEDDDDQALPSLDLAQQGEPDEPDEPIVPHKQDEPGVPNEPNEENERI